MKQKKQSRFKLIWMNFKGSRLSYIGAIISVVIASFLSLIDPLVIRFILDSVFGSVVPALPDWLNIAINSIGGLTVLKNNIWICALALVLINLFQGLFLFLKAVLSQTAAESCAKKMRDSLFTHLESVSYGYFDSSDSGDLIQRCTQDVDTIRRFFAGQFVDIGKAIVMMAMTFIIMMQLNLKMALISSVAIPFVLAFAYFFFKKVQEAFRASDEAEGEMSSILQENMQGLRVVRAFAREEYEKERFDKKNKSYTKVTVRLIDLLGWYWSLSSLLCLSQVGVTIVMGAYMATSGEITLGTMIVFFAYVERILWPVRQLGRMLTDLGKTVVSLDRIGDIFDVQSEFLTSGIKPEIEGSIQFDSVAFEYEKGKEVLKDISFTVKKGETIAILGKTGSGKTTLVHLLNRLYEPTKGSIYIDGININQIDKKHLRRNVCTVLQEAFLFSKSLKENIRMGNPHAEIDDLEKAAKTAGLSEMLSTFKHGWETAVGEEGVTLSGGQKQRASIARALLAKAKILILDDSLSAVDTETDSMIRHELKHASHRYTTIVIAHRITTLMSADKILVLENGIIHEQGTHKELLEKEGLYKRIWNIQADLKDIEMEVVSDTIEEVSEITA